MGKVENSIPLKNVDELYEELRDWSVNTGEEKIYPKRMKGRFRAIKWWTSSVWLVFFLGPYLRWDDRQAVLWDLPNQQFHFFAATLLPQDLWLLSFVLLFFAILLAVATAVAGRVFCGYFCFQTVWTDVYMLIENWLEGSSRQQKQLDAQPWAINYKSARKASIKVLKHSLWLVIAWLTGMSFVAWFMDAVQLWQGFFTFDLASAAWITIGTFIAGTYILAGFMREQTCLWLCPYSRIQGVMIDENSLVPAYDASRGEPRGHIKQHSADQHLGDCIDCHQCVVVCPTGIDIRHGQQQGCITCGLCIDACDSVMEKIGRPKGLVRYESLSGLQQQNQQPWFQSSRVWVYLSIMLISVSAISYGFITRDALELNVIQHRQPLYIRLSDGSIQNQYQLKILNKTAQDKQLSVAITEPKNAVLVIEHPNITAKASGITSVRAFVKTPQGALKRAVTPLEFVVTSEDSVADTAVRRSVFFTPVEM